MYRTLLILATALSAHVAQAEDAANPTARGATLYATYCALCHGPTGHGDGRAAQVQQVKPADLTASQRSDDYKSSIILNGGASVNRSTGMPPWRDVLSADDVADLVVYLRELAMEESKSESASARASGERS
jgi:mono/diheme cytochrome c family protein